VGIISNKLNLPLNLLLKGKDNIMARGVLGAAKEIALLWIV
jgi:hypothetical protein